MLKLQKLAPPHGWPVVLWDLAVVTLGVLVALALQETVTTFHWRSEVDAERDVLHVEVRDNLDAVQDRLVLETCIKQKLAEIGTVLERAARRQPLGITGRVGLPLPSAGAKGAWNIALAGQALAHMPHAEQLGFSNAYSQYENWDRIREEERSAWLDLAILDRPSLLTDDDFVELRKAYARATAAEIRIASVGPFIFRTASMGERPFGLDVAEQRFAKARYGREICRPLIG